MQFMVSLNVPAQLTEQIVSIVLADGIGNPGVHFSLARHAPLVARHRIRSVGHDSTLGVRRHLIRRAVIALGRGGPTIRRPVIVNVARSGNAVGITLAIWTIRPTVEL